MTREDKNVLINKIIEKYKYLQLLKASEECSELAKALNKFYIKQILEPETNHEKEFENIKEEIADVEIMLTQLKKILGITDKELLKIQELKLKRLEKNL